MSVPTAYSYAIYGVPATDLLDDVKPKYDEDCGESYIGTAVRFYDDPDDWQEFVNKGGIVGILVAKSKDTGFNRDAHLLSAPIKFSEDIKAKMDDILIKHNLCGKLYLVSYCSY